MISKINMKEQSKLTFKSYENCDSYTFKPNEVLMDKPIYVGFAILKLSKLHMYRTCYDKLQPYLHNKNYNAFVRILIALF